MGAPDLALVPLFADALDACELGRHRQEQVILFARAHGHAHALAERTDDESGACARFDEAMDTSAQQVEV